MAKVFAFLLLILSVYGCDYFPQDLHKTLHTVQKTKLLKIGVIEHAPWAYRESGLAKGVEPAIVREFASSLGAKPLWKFMSEAEAEDRLKQYQVDLVIGGLTRANPRKKNMGLTRSYYQTGKGQAHQHVLAGPKGENRFIVRLEKFLKDHHSRIQQYYQAEKGT